MRRLSITVGSHGIVDDLRFALQISEILGCLVGALSQMLADTLAVDNLLEQFVHSVYIAPLQVDTIQVVGTDQVALAQFHEQTQVGAAFDEVQAVVIVQEGGELQLGQVLGLVVVIAGEWILGCRAFHFHVAQHAAHHAHGFPVGHVGYCAIHHFVVAGDLDGIQAVQHTALAA